MNHLLSRTPKMVPGDSDDRRPARPVYKILFAAHSGSQGGAELCLDTTLRYLDRRHYEPRAVFASEGPLTQSARDLGLAVDVMPLAWWIYAGRSLWYWKNLTIGAVIRIGRLVRLIRDEGIDLVYTNTATMFEPALAARIARIPHVWHIHEVLESQGRMSQLLPIRWLQCFMRRHSSLVVFESNAARAAFEAATPLPHSAVVYNSLRFDLAGPTPSMGESRRQFDLSKSDRVVGFVGQFIDRKNPLLLIEAISQLEDRRNLVCLFVGDGPLRETMLGEIQRRQLTAVCRLVPFQGDVRPLMAAIDFLVLPSRQESFGLVLVEAGACGKPVVACQSQGPNEIVVDGFTGYLVPQNDPQALANAVQRLVDSPDLCSRLGMAACARVMECFEPKNNTRRLEDLLHDLVAQTVLRPSATKE